MISGPETHVYGERQYAVVDLAGHRWTFTQTVADESPDPQLMALLAACETSPSRAVVREERRRRLREAVASLPDEHREVLRLRYGEGLPTREVARRLNTTDVATRVLLARLVRRLQELLDPAEGP